MTLRQRQCHHHAGLADGGSFEHWAHQAIVDAIAELGVGEATRRKLFQKRQQKRQTTEVRTRKEQEKTEDWLLATDARG